MTFSISQSCITISFETLLSPQKEPSTINNHSPFPSHSPFLQLIYLLSLFLCLFWTLHTPLNFVICSNYVPRSCHEHELVKTEPLLSWRKHTVRFLWAFSHNILLADQMHDLGLCVFLFKGTLFDIYCWFSNFSVMVKSTVTQAWTKLIFSTRLVTASWLGTLDSTSALRLGAILSKTTNKSTKLWNMKTWHQVDHERPLLTVRELKQEAEHGLAWPQLGKHVSGSSKLLHSGHVCEWLWKRLRIDFRVTNKSLASRWICTYEIWK